MLTVNDHPHDWREPDPPPESPALAAAMDVVSVLLVCGAVVAFFHWVFAD